MFSPKKIKDRLGDFWWYSIMIFLAARSCDAVQAFIGLWLVPHYVPQSELGAVLPLLQMASLWGLPLTILLVPFTKFLNTYATRGEFGKVKRLLQITFVCSAAAALFSALAARLVMPMFFTRVRVVDGSLGALVLAVGLLTTFSPVFTSALQALKRFRMIVWMHALGAPIRLIVMLVAMPFRALSGYLLGQLAPSVVWVIGAILGLRKDIGRQVRSVAIGPEDRRLMLRYTIPVAVNLVILTILGAWQATLIRQRLPEVESAAYYLISRLSEVGTYAGMSLVFVMFPLAAESQSRGTESPKLLRNLLAGTLLTGLAVAAGYALFGRTLLKLVPNGTSYIVFAPLLVLLTIRYALIATINNFTSFEMAQNRFGFLVYLLPLAFVETLPLIVLTGAGAFRGKLPDAAVDWMISIHADRLEFFIDWLLAVATTAAAAVAIHLLLRQRSRRKRRTP